MEKTDNYQICDICKKELYNISEEESLSEHDNNLGAINITRVTSKCGTTDVATFCSDKCFKKWINSVTKLKEKKN